MVKQLLLCSIDTKFVTSIKAAISHMEDVIKNERNVLMFATVSLFLIIVLVILILFLRKIHAKRQGITSGIVINFTMTEGNIKNNQNDYMLNNELFIGLDKSKQRMYISDKYISACHARIFVDDGNIYIEDNASKSGTYLGGMRLYNANRLRSGDEIAIGDVEFVIRY